MSKTVSKYLLYCLFYCLTASCAKTTVVATSADVAKPRPSTRDIVEERHRESNLHKRARKKAEVNAKRTRRRPKVKGFSRSKVPVNTFLERRRMEVAGRDAWKPQYSDPRFFGFKKFPRKKNGKIRKKYAKPPFIFNEQSNQPVFERKKNLKKYAKKNKPPNLLE